MQQPAGKILPVSFIGTHPYITYHTGMIPPVGGSEFKFLAMLAEKFRFLPELKAEKSFATVDWDSGTIIGMDERVRALLNIFSAIL